MLEGILGEEDKERALSVNPATPTELDDALGNAVEGTDCELARV